MEKKEARLQLGALLIVGVCALAGMIVGGVCASNMVSGDLLEAAVPTLVLLVSGGVLGAVVGTFLFACVGLVLEGPNELRRGIGYVQMLIRSARGT